MIGAAATVAAPWAVPLTRGEFLVVLYCLTVAALAFLAAFIRSCLTQREVGSRYRTVVVARLAITAVSCVSYIGLLVAFGIGYHHVGTGYAPGPDAVFTVALRYTEWSVAVPLLTVEILAVCALTGRQARRVEAMTFVSAFLMILCGFIGAVVEGDGDSRVGMIVWGLLACVFWAATTVLLLRAVAASKSFLTPEAMALLRRANVFLLSGFVVYPIVYLIPFFFSGGRWAAAIQIAFTFADVSVKVIFGNLLLRVAKLRTAEDVRAGEDVHPESIWISSIKQSDAGRPREVFLAAESVTHRRRSPAPSSSAVATSTAGPWRESDVDDRTAETIDAENL